MEAMSSDISPEGAGFEQLKKEYCPAVDESLVQLICAENSYEDATAFLNTLREAAIVQSSLSDEDEARFPSSSPSIGTSSSAWGFESLSLTNGSASSSSTSSQVSGPAPTWDTVGDKRSNVDELRDMFPEISDVTVQLIYKKCGGDYERVVDELLNLQFLDGQGEVPKGIDGFAAENKPVGKRRKGKKFKSMNDKLTLDVHYVRPPIEGETSASPSLAKRDTNSRVTYRPAPSSATPITTSPQLDQNNAWQSVSPARARAIRTPTPSAAVSAGTATHYHRLASEHFNKARSAHLKANRHNHMGAVAGYYAETGQQLNALAHDHSESAQRSLVHANTIKHGKGDRYLLDLHGATGRIAKDIVREKLACWWGNGGNDGRLRQPFEIICGVGNNSHDGRPVLLPEISKMLMKEKWHFRVERGKVCVLYPKDTVGKKTLAPR